MHVIGALVAGGAERFVVSLIQRMKFDGADPSLCVLSSRCDAVGLEMRAMLTAARIHVEVGPSARVGWGTLKWYARMLSKWRPDIVHLHTPNTEMIQYLSGFILHRKLVYSRYVLFRTIHNTSLPEGWLQRLAYLRNHVECSIACGEAARVSYSRIIAGSLVTIQNGVDFSYPIRSEDNALVARRFLNLEECGYHFMSVGRMAGGALESCQKAQDVVLHAWRRSGLGNRGCYLHLMGDGNLRAELERVAAGDQSIFFHGVSKDVPIWLKAVDCFVMPSRFEGLPIAAIEAVGSGLPCIFTEIPSLRELAPPVALWCKVNDVESLAAQLTTMVQQQPHPSVAATEDFRKSYSIGRTAQEYHRMYAEHGYEL